MIDRPVILLLSLVIIFSATDTAARDVPADSLLSVNQARTLLLKSMVLPGWGEHSLNVHKRGYALNSSELFFWVSYAALLYFGNSAEQDMQSYAAVHAGIETGGKDIYYYTDIGNYNTIHDYNAQKARDRNFGAMYPDTDEYFWAWDSESTRREFDKMRYDSQRLIHSASFALGGLIVNRIVSMIDVIALTKDRIDLPLSDIQTSLAPGRDRMTFSLSVGLK